MLRALLPLLALAVLAAVSAPSLFAQDPVVAPELATCLVSADPDTITVSWQGAPGYDSIEVYLEGVLEAVLPGTATTYTTLPIAALEAEVCVRGVTAGVASAFVCCTAHFARFRRGDYNVDGIVGLADAVNGLWYVFGGGPAPPCYDAADVNDNGSIALNDAIFTLQYLFQGGAPSALPGPLECGVDPTADTLPTDCISSACP